MITTDNIKTMTSTQLAELLGREKKEINREIKKMFKDKIEGGDFTPTLRTNGQVLEYHLPELEAKMFVAKKDINYLEKITKFWIDKNKNKLAQLPANFPEALRALADTVQAKQIVEQKVVEQNVVIKERDDKIVEFRPKVDYYNKVLSADGTVTITEIAKILKITAYALNNYLHDLRIQYQFGNKGCWYLYNKYINNNLAKNSTTINNKEVPCNYLRWTQKGKEAIIATWNKYLYKPWS